MSRTVTLSSLKTQVLQRADMENSVFIDQTTELIGYINNSIAELQDLLISAYGNDYYYSTSNFTTDGVASSYALPADFYKLLGVDLIISTTDFITLKPYMLSERNRYKTSLARSVFGLTNIRYRIQGQNINFIPLPNNGATISLLYVPTLAKLVNSNDTLDGVNGWEEFVVIDAAMKCRIKEESDISDLIASKRAMIDRLTAMAENRDAGMPFRVTDVTNTEYDAARLFDVN